MAPSQRHSRRSAVSSRSNASARARGASTGGRRRARTAWPLPWRPAANAGRAIPPAGGLERDDGPRRQHRDDAGHAELGRGAHDRFHLVALGDRLDEGNAKRGLVVVRADVEHRARRLVADRLEPHGVLRGRRRRRRAPCRRIGAGGRARDDATRRGRRRPGRRGCALRRDRESAHGARVWSSPPPRTTRGGPARDRPAPPRRPPLRVEDAAEDQRAARSQRAPVLLGQSSMGGR